MELRQFVRRVVPAPVLRRRKVVLRAVADWRGGHVFARRRMAVALDHEWSRYSLPFIDYPGQERFARAKRANQARLASFLDGVVIRPGEVFSVWKLAPEPTARGGYELAAVVRAGALGSEPGGSICLLSTVLYNVALLAGLEIVERHCHSLDYYRGRPYFELGRDAAIEWPYLDLRFRNQHAGPLSLRVDVNDERVEASLFGASVREFEVSFVISPPEQLAPLAGDGGRYRVHTTRVVARPGEIQRQDLGWSTHRVPEAVEPVHAPERA